MIKERGIEVVLPITPIVFSCLLLGAHFLRSGNFLLAVLCVFIPLLLLIKKRWVSVVLQLVAYMGGMVWLDTAIDVVRKRISMGLPWNKPVIILGTVALITILSGLLLNLKAVREKYPKA